MLRISNVKVYDLIESIVASGYAMGLNLDDFNIRKENLEYDILNNINFDEWNELSKKEFNRVKKLVNASKNSDIKSHDNFLTGIRVSFDLIYPNYISPEMQRYHWFDIVTSSSKIHRITKMDFDKCCNEYVTDETKKNMKKYIKAYNDVVSQNVPDDEESIRQHSDAAYRAFMTVISNCPQGVELFMRISTNYKQLQTMYYQRKNHRLKEDWGAFCEFVKSLPFSKELITG